MDKFYNKISKDLLNSVFVTGTNEFINCIVFSNNFKKLKTEMLNLSKNIREFPFISAVGVQLNQSEIIKLAKVNVVSYISKQAKVSAQIYISKKILGLNTFYQNGIYGKNSTIAIIDTGINPHLDFIIPKNRIVKFVDLINNKTTPYDDNGHGTFVASIACGNGITSGKKYSGVAPKANIISIKALEKNGETGAYKILEAMQWIFDNKNKYNISVVCMSFGSNPIDKTDPLVLGAEALWNAGIVVISAAGNSGPDGQTIKSPGVSSKIITVGGIDDKRDDKNNYNFKNFVVADFSSRGPANNYFKPDLVCPAVNIVGANFNGGYVNMSGTSVATPMIAGACLLILNKYKGLTPNQVKAKLLRCCKKISVSFNNDGFGIPNFIKFFN